MAEAFLRKQLQLSSTSPFKDLGFQTRKMQRKLHDEENVKLKKKRLLLGIKLLQKNELFENKISTNQYTTLLS